MPSQPVAINARFVLMLMAAGAAGALVSVLAYEVVAPGTAQAQVSNCPAFSHQPGDTDPEVLVGTEPTRLPALCARRGLGIQNHGAASIWCTSSGVAAHARVGRAYEIAPGDGWALDAKDTLPIYCVSESAQAEGAATIVMEMR